MSISEAALNQILGASVREHRAADDMTDEELDAYIHTLLERQSLMRLGGRVAGFVGGAFGVGKLVLFFL
jgi:hypothetical protein